MFSLFIGYSCRLSRCFQVLTLPLSGCVAEEDFETCFSFYTVLSIILDIFFSCSALHTTTIVPQDICTCWISVDLITLKGTVATQWIWQYQFKSKKKNTLIPRIWVLETVFLGINGEAGRGVRGVAPEVPGEGHRPGDLCAEVQEALRTSYHKQALLHLAGQTSLRWYPARHCCQLCIYLLSHSCSTLCLALFSECSFFL